ncbi:YktB family protein [Indiicoccus explosivorum]|uniref:YktB family protein n=1 Tax=Indiicoccus explosivorum TaxID=1917864 RepID=UPI000B43C0C8|nr:DUF1054 domain-containing protein [Indiicoccus explosivorum]
MSSFWTEDDFQVFGVPGLEERMEQLTVQIRPKFEELGSRFAPFLSEAAGDEHFVHIAKHARRTVNPPQDSWVAFAANKRGYKAYPHFQIGLWKSHVFIILAVIYEARSKDRMARDLLENGEVHDLPGDFVLSGDHMKPEAERIGDLSAEEITRLMVRFRDVKKGELVIGRHIPADEAAAMSTERFFSFTEDTFKELLPIYETMVHGVKSTSYSG